MATNNTTSSDVVESALAAGRIPPRCPAPILASWAASGGRCRNQLTIVNANRHSYRHIFWVIFPSGVPKGW